MRRILQSLQKCQRKVQRVGLVADATPDLAWMGHRLVAIEGKNVEIKPGDWRVFHSWKFEPGFWCLTCVWLNELNLFKFYWLNWSFFGVPSLNVFISPPPATFCWDSEKKTFRFFSFFSWISGSRFFTSSDGWIFWRVVWWTWLFLGTGSKKINKQK